MIRKDPNGKNENGKCSPVYHFSGKSPLVLSMPHSIAVIPPDLPAFARSNINFGAPEVDLTLRMGCDYGVSMATGFLNCCSPKYHRVWTTLPRVILDVNRSTEEVDNLSVEGKGEPKHAHGLIWRATAGRHESEMRDILKRPYKEEEFMQLLLYGYYPYQNAVRKAMDAAVADNGLAILVELHTLPIKALGSVNSGRYNGAYALVEREPPRGKFGQGCPDLIMITNGGESAHPLVEQIVREEFETEGYIVDRGIGKLKGDHGATVMYGNPEERKYVIALELADRELETGRMEGRLITNWSEAMKLRPIYKRVFERLSQLRPEDL
jgi:N-formylglutamate amidohydrolase